MPQEQAWSLSEIHHLGLTVTDIERAIGFYRDMLGMELIGRRPSVTADYVAKQTGYPDVELNVASFRVSSGSKQTLEVVQYMSHVGQPSEPATNQAGVYYAPNDESERIDVISIDELTAETGIDVLPMLDIQTKREALDLPLKAGESSDTTDASAQEPDWMLFVWAILEWLLAQLKA